jgi:hypothetical protein
MDLKNPLLFTKNTLLTLLTMQLEITGPLGACAVVGGGLVPVVKPPDILRIKSLWLEVGLKAINEGTDSKVCLVVR